MATPEKDISIENTREAQSGVMAEIIAEQKHGRQKYGGDENNVHHDDAHSIEDWLKFIRDHATRAECSTPRDARQHLIKIAGLAKSAAEAFDRNTEQAEKGVAAAVAEIAENACLKAFGHER